MFKSTLECLWRVGILCVLWTWQLTSVYTYVRKFTFTEPYRSSRLSEFHLTASRCPGVTKRTAGECRCCECQVRRCTAPPPVHSAFDGDRDSTLTSYLATWGQTCLGTRQSRWSEAPDPPASPLYKGQTTGGGLPSVHSNMSAVDVTPITLHTPGEGVELSMGEGRGVTWRVRMDGELYPTVLK